MTDNPDDTASPPYSRRKFLVQLGAVGAAGLAAPLIRDVAVGAATPKAKGPTLLGKAKRTSPIKTIVVSIQENHSFDHYLGSYAALAKLPGGTTAAGYGIPKGWKNSNIAPFEFTTLTDNGYDPNHDWTSTHAAYAGGKMTGFVSNGNNKNAMGYYTATQLPYYYSLLPEYTLCAEYFCGVLSETLPNRLVAYAGTSGGITDDSAPANGSLTWPCITHLLGAAGIKYANYNFHAPSNYSYLCLFSGNNNRAYLNRTTTQFASDCKNGTLPNVVWIERQTPWDEHPPANIQQGETMMEGIFKQIMAGPQWKKGEVAILHTYDEGGGFFDHRPPTELDGFGSGIRVPMIVISPIAKQGHIDTTYSDHASINKFIEHVYGLPTLASVNHQFDKSTPPGLGQGGGKPFPPRDGNAAISNLTQCFSVSV
jgi:phospholipase C